ncbi:hypothetical protein EYF80_012784 [Liparis tanakae]|uniref:Uncharacterized protein n=1 Tax=Liparis tanakae TaxID=230148 RepID=A0A4Z2IGA2_9TELE|nr:hypothetical protein EYF80_012784 [Liparis tanakae]
MEPKADTPPSPDKPEKAHTHLPKAMKLMTHCSTEMTCRCFSILDLQGQKARDRSCSAERMLQPVPAGKR